jgi:hypothetical protein
MSAMPSPAQSEFSEGSLPVKPPAEAPVIRPADLKNDRSPKRQQSLGMRAPLAIARFLITFCVGVAATLAWQSYGDTAREMIANASPRPASSRPAADGARDQQTAGDGTIHALQELRASAAAGKCSGSCPQARSAAGAGAGAGALTDRSHLVISPRH